MSGVLIAGIGNVFLGDDAFGVEVVARLRDRALPHGVTARDFGIRGIDLTYALCDGLDAAILVDTVARGSAPGTLYVIEPDDPQKPAEATAHVPLIAAHAMDPRTVLQIVRSMGGECRRVLVVGCEPESFGTEDDAEGRMGLSATVADAVGRAADLVVSLAARISRGTDIDDPASTTTPVRRASTPQGSQLPRQRLSLNDRKG